MGKDAVGNILGADGGFLCVDLGLFCRLDFVLIPFLRSAGFSAQIVLMELILTFLFFPKGLLFLRGQDDLPQMGRYITAYEIEVNLNLLGKDAVMKALQDIYWESKARNVQKYTPKKYTES